MSESHGYSTHLMTRRTVVRLIASTPWLAGSLLAACSVPSLSSQPASFSATPVTLGPGGTFDHFIAQRVAQGQFSGTILVAKGQQPTLERTYGWANQAQHIPNRLETIYALASITKSFTEVAILQLMQQGKLALQDHLGKYLSGFLPAIASTVTIHQLLVHTSGMGDYIQASQFRSEKGSWTSAAQTMTGLLNIIRQQPLLFAPGARYSYSNSGYVVLGAIVQQIAGQSYYDYIRQHIFRAAGMSQSDFYTRPQRAQNALIAHPYSRRIGENPTGPQNPTEPRSDASSTQGFIGGPDGGAYSTVEDMLRYSWALQTHRLLGTAAMKVLIPGKITHPGARPVPGRSVNGGTAGIATNIEIYPTLGWTVVILSNYDPDQNFNALVKEAGQLVAQA